MARIQHETLFIMLVTHSFYWIIIQNSLASEPAVLFKFISFSFYFMFLSTFQMLTEVFNFSQHLGVTHAFAWCSQRHAYSSLCCAYYHISPSTVSPFFPKIFKRKEIEGLCLNANVTWMANEATWTLPSRYKFWHGHLLFWSFWSFLKIL